MTDNIITYSSGFLGVNTTQTVIDKNELNINDVISNVKLNKKNTISSKPKVYNKEIVALIQRYEKDTAQSSDIVFICDLIEAAFRAFDFKLINTWLALQIKNPLLSDNHIRFIEDTFSFIKEGKRSINIMSWARMLSAGDAGTTTNTKKINIISLVGSSSFNQMAPGTSKTGDLLTQWVSQPNGVEDLIYSLHVLFGKV